MNVVVVVVDDGTSLLTTTLFYTLNYNSLADDDRNYRFTVSLRDKHSFPI